MTKAELEKVKYLIDDFMLPDFMYINYDIFVKAVEQAGLLTGTCETCKNLYYHENESMKLCSDPNDICGMCINNRLYKNYYEGVDNETE